MSDPTAGPTPPAPAAGPPPGAPGQPIAPPPGWQPQPGQPQPGQPQPGQPQPGPPGAYPPGSYAPQGPGGPYAGPPPAAPSGTKVGPGVLLALVAIAGMALAVSVEEDGDNGWGRIGVWAGFAIATAVLTLAPAVKEQLNLTEARAWLVGAVGAGGLVAFWILFVLPSISMNVSFAATVATAAGVAAAWLAPGRPTPDGGAGQTW